MKDKTFVIAPLLVAVSIFVADRIWLTPFLEENRFQDIWVFTVTANIALRLAIGIWTVSLTREHKLHQTLWVILGLIFGLTQLVVINFAIWIRPLYNQEKD